MNAMTPTIADQVSILEFLADPERPRALLEATRAAEQAQAKASAMLAEAAAAMKAAADELAKAREVQDINTKKSGALRDQAEHLAAEAQRLQAEHEQNKASLAEWEGRIKTTEALVAAQAQAVANAQAELDAAVAAHSQRVAEAEAVITRAEAIKAAMGA